MQLFLILGAREENLWQRCKTSPTVLWGYEMLRAIFMGWNNTKVEDNHSGSKIWQNLAFFNSINFPFLRHPFLGIKAPLGVKMPHLSKNGQ